MPTTAEALEAMTDRALFERLASAYLRRTRPELSGLIHTGVNAQGEAIVDPVDGLHAVPESVPPKFIFVQHTTTDSARLRSKWITSESSDLVKAAREAELVRADIPNAEFFVFLCTNQRCGSELAREIYVWAASKGLGAQVVEQTVLSDFLDNTPDGQWIRQSYLGIKAQRLSQELLRNLALKSRAAYRARVLFESRVSPVATQTSEQLSRVLSRAEHSVVMFSGPSGCGKSVAVLQVLDRAAKDGAIAIWMPAKFIDRAEGLESALFQWLHELHPYLVNDGGGLAPAQSLSPLLLAIDDIQELNNPAAILGNTVVQVCTAHDATDNSSSADATARMTTVIPVWPVTLSQLPERILRNAKVTTAEAVGFQREESIAVLETALPNLTVLERARCASALGDDPFAIGAFIDSISRDSSAREAEERCSTKVEGLIREGISRALTAAGGSILRTDVEAALMNIGLNMLTKRAFNPRVLDATTWLQGETQQRALRYILSNAFLCAESDVATIRFRHDRVRDRILTDAAQRLISNDISDPTLADPFFAPYVAQAVIQQGLSPTVVEHFCRVNPLSIAHLIEILGPSIEQHRSIRSVILEWARGYPWTKHHSIAWAFTLRFLSANSPVVPELCLLFPRSTRRQLAAFRSGAAESGALYFGSLDAIDFEPASTDPVRDACVEHARKYHAEQLRRQVFAVNLQGLDMKRVAGYLTLIGYMQWQGMDELIRRLWQIDTTKLLPHAVWAASRCAQGSEIELAKELISALCEGELIPHELPNASQLDWQRQSFQRSLRHGISSNVIDWIVMRARDGGQFSERYSYVLAHVDRPDAVECTARQSVGLSNEPWGSLTVIGDGELEFISKSRESQTRLFEVWSNANEADKVRLKAFCMWLKTSPNVALDQLRAILPNEPYYMFAIQHRVKLGDLSAAKPLIDLITNSKVGDWWWRLAHRVWSAPLMDAAQQQIERQRGSTEHKGFHWLAELAVKLPVEEAVKLLVPNWDVVSRDWNVVNAAVRVASPECLAQARAVIESTQSRDEALQYASHPWHHPLPNNPVTRSLLERTMPVLSLWPKGQLRSLVMHLCRRSATTRDVRDFAREFIEPLVPLEEGRAPQGSARWAFEELDDQLSRSPPFVHHIFDSAPGSDLTLEEVFNWYGLRRRIDAYLVLVECVAVAGKRAHLKYLELVPEDASEDEVRGLVENARFEVMSRNLQ